MKLDINGFDRRKRKTVCGKAGRKTGGFCLARPWGRGTSPLVAWPRNPLPGTCGKDSRVFRNREDVTSGNLRNFTMGRRFGIVCNRARPAFPSSHQAILRASRGAGAVGVPFLLPDRRIRAFAKSRKDGTCNPPRASGTMRTAPTAVLAGTLHPCGGRGASGMGAGHDRSAAKHGGGRQAAPMRIPSEASPGF